MSIVKFYGKTCTLVKAGHYNSEDGPLALRLIGEDGGVQATVTVNIPGETPAEGCVFIKDWSENEGVLEAMTKAGLMKMTGRFVPTGRTVAVEAKLLVDIRDF